MRSLITAVILVGALLPGAMAQQADSPKDQSKKSESQAAAKNQEKKSENAAKAPEAGPTVPDEHKADSASAGDKEEHYDVTEVTPIVTHHQITLDGRTLKYTATAGRLPIKRDDGKIEAEMFFVAYALDGQDARQASVDVCIQWRSGIGVNLVAYGSAGPASA